jgi:hypothetical protein
MSKMRKRVVAARCLIDAKTALQAGRFFTETRPGNINHQAELVVLDRSNNFRTLSLLSGCLAP